MKVLRLIGASFSMYSRLPMPRFEMKDDDMKNCIMFLPLTGLICGAALFGLVRLLSGQPVPVSVKGLVAALIPLIITGGFHFDGFMDTVDAISSYRKKDKKLEILADPHIGSFAVIRTAMVLMLLVAGLCITINIETTKDIPAVILVCGIFVISRALAGLTSILMKKAKEDGMLAEETDGSMNAAIIVLMIQLIAVLSFMAYIDVIHTGVILVAFAAYTVFYRYIVMKNFGGVTGDTAGYYVTVSEVFAICVLAVSLIITTGLHNATQIL